MEIYVLINGSLRACVEVPKDSTEEELKALVLKNEKIAEILGSRAYKIVVVPNLLVSIHC